MTHFSPRLSSWLLRYYLGADHPFKIRLWGLMEKALGCPKYVVPFFGGQIALDLRDLLQREIIMHRDYEPEVWAAARSFLQPGDTVFDIGAHVGSFSIKACHDSRVAKVLSFEPNPKTLTHLRLNRQLNANRFEIQEFGLGNRRAALDLYDGEQGNIGRASLVFQRTQERPAARVEIFTLDELVESKAIPAPNVVKIDVEGFEKQVLQGASRTLARPGVRAIVFETKPNGQAIADPELVALLDSHRFSVRLVPRMSGVTEEFENFLAYRA